MDIRSPQFSRRRFLRALGQGALLAALPSPLFAEEPNAVAISILHTTDLHGHILPTVDYNDHPNLGGLARCATQFRRWQTANPHSILVDIGDLYQGTQVGLGSRGAVMVRCLNALRYDAWVIGNHDFDWGIETLAGALDLSAMPVLSGNALIAGKAVGTPAASAGGPAKLKPYLIKEVAGFRLAFIGLTTPALSTWLPPEYLKGYEALDPIEALRPLLREVQAQHRPDAILIAGHMGLTRSDDNANRVGALTREFPQITAYLGGHTHKNHSGERVNNVLYTQADHYGIYAGKVDLTFDRTTRRLLHREAVTVPMDASVPLDPLVLSVAHQDLDSAREILKHPVGELTETFAVRSAAGEPSDVERLIGSAMAAALHQSGAAADVIVHGLFDSRHPLKAGTKTIRDIWDLLPYENQIVTVDLSRADLLAFIQDFTGGAEFRGVMGVQVIGKKEAGRFTVTDLRSLDGSPLPDKSTWRVALNSYDSQSAGQRFTTAARIVARPSSRRLLHPVQTREALIDFFAARQKIGKSSLLV